MTFCRDGFFLNCKSTNVIDEKKPRKWWYYHFFYDFLSLLLGLNSWPWLKNYVSKNIYD